VIKPFAHDRLSVPKMKNTLKTTMAADKPATAGFSRSFPPEGGTSAPQSEVVGPRGARTFDVRTRDDGGAVHWQAARLIAVKGGTTGRSEAPNQATPGSTRAGSVFCVAVKLHPTRFREDSWSFRQA